MERTKKFKFNILDIVIILVALACIAGVFSRHRLSNIKGISSTQNVKITFSVSNIRNTNLDETLLNGDRFYCDTFRGYFGELCDRDQFEITPAKWYNENKDGTVIQSRLNYRYDIVGYMTSTGKYDPNRGFLVNGVNLISPGQTYEIHSINRYFAVTVLSVEIIE